MLCVAGAETKDILVAAQKSGYAFGFDASNPQAVSVRPHAT
jgi:hypothetical protein